MPDKDTPIETTPSQPRIPMSTSQLVEDYFRSGSTLILAAAFNLHKPEWTTMAVLIANMVVPFVKFINFDIARVNEQEYLEFMEFTTPMNNPHQGELETAAIRELINLVNNPDNSTTVDFEEQLKFIADITEQVA